MRPGRRRVTMAAIGVVMVAAVVVPFVGPETTAQQDVPTCTPGGAPVVIADTAQPASAKTYRLYPFEVTAGTTRVEVGYRWDDALGLPSTPLTQSVIDLGLWDADGADTPDGFRGWSGSRQGKTAEGQDPVFVQADDAERGYRAAPIEAGIWHVEAGIAAVAPGGVDFELTVSCYDPVTGPAPTPDPVDPTHVADPEPGWYAGDFHMHGYHSNASAPPFDDGDPSDVDSFVEYARDAGLDFLPVTEYVTTVHHDELGAVQRANPDLVVWPSREVITYHGHATVFGETPSTVEYRHGYDGISLGDIQADTVADGALFGLAHPTIFPTELFASFCRGCEFTLEDAIDLDQVSTYELVTGPILVDDTSLGGPGLGVKVQNPFVVTAIAEWQELLRAGHRITAVSGSDDKAGPDLGTNATRVYAESLSRADLAAGIDGGHAYIQTMGADGPTIEVDAVTPTGERGTIGDTLAASSAQVTVRVQGASGQLMTVIHDGLPAGIVPVTSDDFTHTFAATTGPFAGPLGSFWRVDVSDLSVQALSIITNPIFLDPEADTDGDRPQPEDPETDPAPGDPEPGDRAPAERTPAEPAGRGVEVLPATGGDSSWLAAAAAMLLAVVLRRRARAWTLRGLAGGNPLAPRGSAEDGRASSPGR